MSNQNHAAAPATRLLLALVAATALLAPLYGQDYPKAEIDNGTIKAGLYLPDAEKGSYRATRFDWSGIIYSLEFKGHQYFGMWRPKHDPLASDAITGPAESFDTDGAGLGYAEAAPGGQFIRIGVGVVEKPEERAFSALKTYKVIDPGKWKVSQGKNWIEFQQTLTSKIGYAYVYIKRVTLVEGKPELVITHSLKNTGNQLISTTQFNHNFFVMDGKVSGPGITVKFPFDLKVVGDFRGMLEGKGRELTYLKELTGNQSAQSLLQGYGDTAKDHEIVIENKLAGAGVKITGDKSLVRLNFSTRKETVCPEPYIQLRIPSGKAEKWETRYQFYTLN
jgi:hypothetical protein